MTKAKQVAGLDSGTEAVRGIRLVLRARLDELCQLGRTALDWASPEDVHNFRIALHRLRSAMRDFKPYLQLERLMAARRQLKTLAGALSAVRNQDVIIAELERLGREAPFELSEGIEVLKDEALRTRDHLLDELIKAANDAALIELQQEFTDGLEKMLERKTESYESNSPLSFRQAAHQIILVHLRKLQDLGSCLYQPFKTMRIYRTRIAAKSLRYALDLYGACWLEGPVESLAEEVARLQSSLGKLHDCDLVIRELSTRLSSSAREIPGAGVDAYEEQRRAAAVWLLCQLTRSRAKHYRDALMLWYEWESNDFDRRFFAILDD